MDAERCESSTSTIFNLESTKSEQLYLSDTLMQIISNYNHNRRHNKYRQQTNNRMQINVKCGCLMREDDSRWTLSLNETQEISIFCFPALQFSLYCTLYSPSALQVSQWSQTYCYHQFWLVKVKESKQVDRPGPSLSRRGQYTILTVTKSVVSFYQCIILWCIT